MKYIKYFENTTNQLKINILDFYKLVGNMFDTVEYLIKIDEISEYITISEDPEKYKKKYYKIIHDKLTDSNYNIEKGDDDAILLIGDSGDISCSLGYIKYQKNITITFNNISIDFLENYKDIITYFDTKKYNL